MEAGDPKVWVVRHGDKTTHVERVVIGARMVTVFEPDAQQPRARIEGRADIAIIDGVAHILPEAK